MTEEIIEISNKNQPSEELLEAIHGLANNIYNMEKSIERIIELAKKEDYPLVLVGGMIRDILKQKGITETTINRKLPTELKDHSKTRTMLPSIDHNMTSNDDNNHIEDVRQNIEVTQISTPMMENKEIVVTLDLNKYKQLVHDFQRKIIEGKIEMYIDVNTCKINKIDAT